MSLGAQERWPIPDAPVTPFDAFVGAHRDRAVRLAWRMLGDEQAARDVSQDAFLAVAGSLGSLRDIGRMEGWFYRTLVRRAHNHRRWRAVRDRFTGPWREPRASDPEPGLRGRIDRAVAALSDGQRHAFVLVHVEGSPLTSFLPVPAPSPAPTPVPQPVVAPAPECAVPPTPPHRALIADPIYPKEVSERRFGDVKVLIQVNAWGGASEVTVHEGLG